MSNTDRHQDRKGNLIGAKNNFEKGLVEYEKQKVGPVQHLQYYLVLFNDSKLADPLFFSRYPEEGARHGHYDRDFPDWFQTGGWSLQ